MYKMIRSTELNRLPSGTVRFEGEPHGSGASFFHVNNEPGKGSSLHMHPYPETWIVRTGEVQFTVGGETIEAGTGDVVVAAANLPHKYLNIGTEQLEMICIHPSPQIIQEALE